MRGASPIIKEKGLYLKKKERKKQIIKCVELTWRGSDSKNKVPI